MIRNIFSKEKDKKEASSGRSNQRIKEKEQEKKN